MSKTNLLLLWCIYLLPLYHTYKAIAPITAVKPLAPLPNTTPTTTTQQYQQQLRWLKYWLCVSPLLTLQTLPFNVYALVDKHVPFYRQFFLLYVLYLQSNYTNGIDKVWTVVEPLLNRYEPVIDSTLQHWKSKARGHTYIVSEQMVQWVKHQLLILLTQSRSVAVRTINTTRKSFGKPPMDDDRSEVVPTASNGSAQATDWKQQLRAAAFSSMLPLGTTTQPSQTVKPSSSIDKVVNDINHSLVGPD